MSATVANSHRISCQFPIWAPLRTPCHKLLVSHNESYHFVQLALLMMLNEQTLRNLPKFPATFLSGPC